jgi:hypothetical protein
VEVSFIFFFFSGNTMKKVIELTPNPINEGLAQTLEKLLEMAEQGRLQSFVGVGLLTAGDTVTVTNMGEGADLFKLLGCATSLQFLVADKID